MAWCVGVWGFVLGVVWLVFNACCFSFVFCLLVSFVGSCFVFVVCGLKFGVWCVFGVCCSLIVDRSLNVGCVLFVV